MATLSSRVLGICVVAGVVTGTWLVVSRAISAESEETAPAAANSPATGEQTPAPKPSPESARKRSPRDEKLEEIQGKLRDLLQEVEALKGSPPPATAPSAAPSAAAGTQISLPESWLKALTWRSIGPANMGGRIVDLAVCEKDPSLFWSATASGGLLKTVNNGVTLEHQFDRQNTVSLGAVAVAPSDPQTVWVGTGENNPRNSVSYGDGIYKSTDGGKTWQHAGLEESYQTGRIVIHPQDPKIVYVAALGRLYGPHERRGVFKTTDGGTSWQRVFYIDDKTGAIDLRMHPTNPETLIVAMWQRQRDGFDSWPGTEVPRPDGYNGYDPIVKWGPGSGLYKTTDGGRNWRKLTQGLPNGMLGRIGLDWHRKNPNILYAIIDGENIGKGLKPLDVYLGLVGRDEGGKVRVVQILPDSPAAKAELQIGDLIASLDGQPVTGFDPLLESLRGKRPGNTIKLVVARGNDNKEFEITLTARPESVGGTGSNVWLGVTGETREGKAVLTQVIADAPAAKAGLEVGDVIAAIDDKPVPGFNELIDTARARQAGEKVKLQIVRGTDKRTVELTLENRPGPPPQADVYLGIQGEDAPGGARLSAITEGGPAEKAGLQSGDVIQAVDDKPVANYEALSAQIRARKAGDEMRMKVARGEQALDITAKLESRPGANRPYGNSLGGQNPNIQDQQGSVGPDCGGVYRSQDGGESWQRVNSLNPRPMYFSQIRVDPNDDQYVYVLGVSQYLSSNGGATFRDDFGRGVHADGHAMWVDPRDGRHIIIGTDGGTYVTYDRGAHWDHLNHTAIGQFYHVAISLKEPYWVTGGLQDNGSWMGPSQGKTGLGPINEDWISVAGSDGFVCRVDVHDPDVVYYTAQDGNIGRRNLRTGEQQAIRPQRANGAPPYRFNWNTPFILSHHNSRIFYSAGNYVFRSVDRGDALQVISPEITLTSRGSATALAESPRNPNLLYVGTDDGALWVTRDGGREWMDIGKKVGLPGPRWVATLEASRFDEGTVYAAFDGHRSDDDEPYVYVSEDYGQTWRSLRANLPRGSTRCLREDLENRNLLFLGTEFAAWCSLDRGRTWNKMNTNLPTVAVHEFALHPRNGELVAATHGRSLWIADISALRQIRPEHLVDKAALYAPAPTIRWHREPRRGSTNRRFAGENPPSSAQIYYALPKAAAQVSLKIIDIEGNVVRELRGPSEAGLHRVSWDLIRSVPRTRGAGGSPGPTPEGRAAPETRSSSRSRTSSSGPAPLGTYRVELTVDGQVLSKTLRLERDPEAPEDARLDATEPTDNPEEREREAAHGAVRIDD